MSNTLAEIRFIAEKWLTSLWSVEPMFSVIAKTIGKWHLTHSSSHSLTVWFVSNFHNREDNFQKLLFPHPEILAFSSYGLSQHYFEGLMSLASQSLCRIMPAVNHLRIPLSTKENSTQQVANTLRRNTHVSLTLVQKGSWWKLTLSLSWNLESSLSVVWNLAHLWNRRAEYMLRYASRKNFAEQKRSHTSKF